MNSKDYKLIEDGGTCVCSFSEKHGVLTYVVNSEQELHAVCCHVLKTRLDGGWYDWYMVEPENDTGFDTEEEVNALPDGTVKEGAIKAFGSYREQLKCHSEALDFNKGISDALIYEYNPEDHIYIRNQAYYLLDGRSDGEYEGINLKLSDKIPVLESGVVKHG